MTNKKFCNICELQVSQNDLKCVFCKHLFHISCSQVELNDAAIVSKDNNIHWFCDQCNVFSHSDILIVILKKITAMDKSMSEIRSEVSGFTDAHRKVMASVSLKGPIKNDSPAMNTRKRNASKRRGPDIDSSEVVPAKKGVVPLTDGSTEENVHNKTFRDAVLDQGASTSTNVTNLQVVDLTKSNTSTIIQTSSSSCGTNDIQSIEPLSTVEGNKWIFVSRLNPKTVDNQVIHHLSSALGIASNEIICNKLIKRGISSELISYMSFKVGVKSSIFDRAIDSSIWPPGSIVHEFKPRSKNWPRLPPLSHQTRNSMQ